MIDYVCFTSPCGYAEAARNNILALVESNVDVRLSPLGMETGFSHVCQKHQELNALVGKAFSYQNIQVFHSIPDLQRRKLRQDRCLKTVGFATFETINPPRYWVDILNKNNAVICPSEFNAISFKEAGIAKPIFTIPHCLDFTVYNTNVNPLKLTDNFSFIFFGTWKKRKGYQQLIQAFYEEFSPVDGVDLILLSRGQGIDSFLFPYKKRKPDLKIIHISKYLSDFEISSILKGANCLISPTLGEGFGYPGLQSLAVGTPILITDYSGCQEYASANTAELLTPEKFERIDSLDGLVQFANKDWPVISVEQIKSKMRKIYNNYDEAKKKAIHGAEFVKKFSYKMVAEKFNDVIKYFT